MSSLRIITLQELATNPWYSIRLLALLPVFLWPAVLTCHSATSNQPQSLLGLLLLHPGHWPCQPLHSTTKGTPPKNNHFLSGIAQITSPLPLVKAKKISSIVVLHLCWCKCSSTFRDYSVKQRETIAWCLMDFSSKGTSPSLWVNIPLRIVPKILIWRWNFPSQKSQ